MKKQRKPKKVGKVANGKSINLQFIHTDNYTVIAEITASDTEGRLRMIRKDEKDWVLLDDNLDRVKLFEGVIPHQLNVDVEKHYVKSITDQFVT